MRLTIITALLALASSCSLALGQGALPAPDFQTQAVDTNTTKAATTAFVLGQASAVLPLIHGTAAIGTSKRYARADHVHPYIGDGAWTENTSFNASLTWPTAAPTTYTSRMAWRQTGSKTYDVRLNITITTVGSANGIVYFTFPNGATPKVKQACAMGDNAAFTSNYWGMAYDSGVIEAQVPAWAAREYSVKCNSVEVN